jgi:hypothetical protein
MDDGLWQDLATRFGLPQLIPCTLMICPPVQVFLRAIKAFLLATEMG